MTYLHAARGPHHHPRRGRRRGPFEHGLGDLGPGPAFDRPARGRRRGRRPRGDIRLAVLALLAERPRHGYEIIHEVAERTDGAWRPSPGSVYPTLQQLEDEGLVGTEETEGRRTVSLTEAGSHYVEEHRDELGRVWQVDAEAPDAAIAELRDQWGQLHAAVLQIVSAGTDAQRESAAAALAEARKAIYRLLAE